MILSKQQKLFFVVRTFLSYWGSDKEALVDWLERDFHLTEDEINQVWEYALHFLMLPEEKNQRLTDFIESETTDDIEES